MTIWMQQSASVLKLLQIVEKVGKCTLIYILWNNGRRDLIWWSWSALVCRPSVEEEKIPEVEEEISEDLTSLWDEDDEAEDLTSVTSLWDEDDEAELEFPEVEKEKEEITEDLTSVWDDEEGYEDATDLGQVWHVKCCLNPEIC